MFFVQHYRLHEDKLEVGPMHAKPHGQLWSRGAPSLSIQDCSVAAPADWCSRGAIRPVVPVVALDKGHSLKGNIKRSGHYTRQ